MWGALPSLHLTKIRCLQQFTCNSHASRLTRMGTGAQPLSTSSLCSAPTSGPEVTENKGLPSSLRASGIPCRPDLAYSSIRPELWATFAYIDEAQVKAESAFSRLGRQRRVRPVDQYRCNAMKNNVGSVIWQRIKIASIVMPRGKAWFRPPCMLLDAQLKWPCVKSRQCVASDRPFKKRSPRCLCSRNARTVTGR